jgi:hypothetical protein
MEYETTEYIVKTSETAPITVNFVDIPKWPKGYGKIG